LEDPYYVRDFETFIIVQDLISMSLKVLNLMVLYMILARVLIKAISVKSIFKSNTVNERIVRNLFCW